MPRGYPGKTPDKKEKAENSPTFDENGKFAKGKEGGPGRKAGIPNKMTRELRSAILEAASTANPEGLVAYLVEQAQKENPSPFMNLLGKIIPQLHEVGKPGDFSKLADDELDAELNKATREVFGVITAAGGASGERLN